jgi:hypothetical protein
MDHAETFQRQGQRVSANDILQHIASGNEILLENCTVSGNLDISRFLAKDEGFELKKLSIADVDGCSVITIQAPISLRSCVFEGDVSFAPPWDEKDMLKVVFDKNAAFNSSEFLGQCRFSGVEFKQIASFDGCVFRRVTGFRGVKFCGRSYFRTVEFCGYGLFNGSIFCDEARFTNTCFTRGGNFSKVRFKGRTDFSGVFARSKSVPVYDSVHFARYGYGDDETFWRFIKQAAQEAGHYQQAGECFYNERCAHFWRRFRGSSYADLSVGKKMIRVISGVRLLPELVFGRWLFGYGERPIRVLFASAAVVLICALFYCTDYSQLTMRSDVTGDVSKFLDGLYFSVTTFTTLGYGDMYPQQHHLLTRCVAMGEALCGAFLMALFVVTLSKRYSRG